MSDSINFDSIDFESLLEHAPDAVVVHDLEDRVIFWNAAAAALYGWSSEELLGQPVTQVLYRDGEGRAKAVEVLNEAGNWEGECTHYDRLGGEHRVRVRQLLKRDQDGHAHAIVSFNSDVNELRHSSEAERRMRKVESSNLLAGGMAHDLNNALAPITLSTAMLERLVEDERALKIVKMVDRCAHRTAALVSEMLAFERGRYVGFEPITVSQLKRALRVAGEELIPDLVDYQVDVAEDARGSVGDLAELEKCFRHVIQNAAEALSQKSEHPSLNVEVCNRYVDADVAGFGQGVEAGDYISIDFTDNGPGVDPEALEHLAEPRFTSKAPNQGFGFGLSKTQAIVKGHKGCMLFSSDPGCGFSATILLPASPVVENSPASEHPVFEWIPGKGEGILVVDDEESVVSAMRMTLEGLGYKVVAAQDGSEALALYSKQQDAIDLVIVDIAMPFVDGPEFCAALKKINPSAKIVVSTGQQQVERLQGVKASGIESFLMKPYSADTLADTVHRLLNKL